MPLEERIPELHHDILEAIATLTNRTPGDIFYKIQNGEFKTVALEALKAFSQNFYMMDRKGDTDPIDDLEILNRCLNDLQDELLIATDPVEVRDIKGDIKDILQRIQITES